MDVTWATIEELARTSDDSAVRRRYSQRNILWLTVLLVLFSFVSVIESMVDTNSRTLLQLALGPVHAGVVALVWYALYGKSLRQWTRRHINSVIIGFLAVQYAILLTFTARDGDWVGWVNVLPWLVLGFRMATAELVLLHVILAAGGLIMPFLGTPIRNQDRVMIAIVAINAVTLAIDLFFSWRMRRQIVGELTERRTHAREQIRMRDELHYARELQLSMIPEQAPALPWADISSVSVPATEVGGDYYDYFVEGDRVALVCGDVAGHGMASGLVLSALRSGFTLLRDSLHDPAAVLRRLHDLVAQTSRRRMLVTVSVVLLDHAMRRAIVASAGHPPVLLRRTDGRVESIDLFAPPLGVRLPVDIPQRTLDIASGDTFVLHSDGVYETRSADGVDYGMERLEEVVRVHGRGSAEELRDAIVRDVAEFRGSSVPADDVTVVVCRVL